MLVSKSAGHILLSVDDATDVDDTTCSVISFIILYGLVPRNDLGKYCSSMEVSLNSALAAALALVAAALAAASETALLEFTVVVS